MRGSLSERSERSPVIGSLRGLVANDGHIRLRQNVIVSDVGDRIRESRLNTWAESPSSLVI